MKNNLISILKIMAKSSKIFKKAMMTVPSMCESFNFSKNYKETKYTRTTDIEYASNPLLDYFNKLEEGPGLWKWTHYFEVYHRHLQKFVGKDVDVLEIGIFSGGSLMMWKSYFGDKSHIYGVDIEDACKSYESENVSVFIGDQEDRNFWKTFKIQVGGIDVLIDDGGHTPEQQRITLEEILGYIRPGGVYICEDVHGNFNQFATYALGLVNELNHINRLGSELVTEATKFQSSIHSIHFYPYMVVIEKHLNPITQLSAPKHGTEWQPFLAFEQSK